MNESKAKTRSDKNAARTKFRFDESIVPSFVVSFHSTRAENSSSEDEKQPDQDLSYRTHRKSSSSSYFPSNRLDPTDNKSESPTKISRSRSFNLINTLKAERHSNKGNLKSSIESTGESCLKSLLFLPKIGRNSLFVDRKFSSQEEKFEFYGRRKRELDRVVDELIKVVERQFNQVVAQTSNFWVEMKRLCVDRLDDENGIEHFHDYVFPSLGDDDRLKTLLTHNEDLQAGIQVLKTTLFIFKEKFTLAELKSLFDDEEKFNRDQLVHQMNMLVISYQKTHRLIDERIHFYKTNRLDNQFDWTDVIQNDYFPLIEQISNDFVTRILSTPENLLSMLVNVKKRLLLLSIEWKLDSFYLVEKIRFEPLFQIDAPFHQLSNEKQETTSADFLSLFISLQRFSPAEFSFVEFLRFVVRSSSSVVRFPRSTSWTTRRASKQSRGSNKSSFEFLFRYFVVRNFVEFRFADRLQTVQSFDSLFPGELNTSDVLSSRRSSLDRTSICVPSTSFVEKTIDRRPPLFPFQPTNVADGQLPAQLRFKFVNRTRTCDVERSTSLRRKNRSPLSTKIFEKLVNCAWLVVSMVADSIEFKFAPSESERNDVEMTRLRIAVSFTNWGERCLSTSCADLMKFVGRQSFSFLPSIFHSSQKFLRLFFNWFSRFALFATQSNQVSRCRAIFSSRELVSSLVCRFVRCE